MVKNWVITKLADLNKKIKRSKNNRIMKKNLIKFLTNIPKQNKNKF